MFGNKSIRRPCNKTLSKHIHSVNLMCSLSTVAGVSHKKSTPHETPVTSTVLNDTTKGALSRRPYSWVLWGKYTPTRKVHTTLAVLLLARTCKANINLYTEARVHWKHNRVSEKYSSPHHQNEGRSHVKLQTYY